MKKEKLNFHQALKNPFGEAIQVKTESGKDLVDVWLDRELVGMLSNPSSIPDETKLDATAVIKRLTLQQKIALDKEQEYSSDEITLIREAVLTLYNKKQANLQSVGTILKMTE